MFSESSELHGQTEGEYDLKEYIKKCFPKKKLKLSDKDAQDQKDYDSWMNCPAN